MNKTQHDFSGTSESPQNTTVSIYSCQANTECVVEPFNLNKKTTLAQSPTHEKSDKSIRSKNVSTKSLNILNSPANSSIISSNMPFEIEKDGPFCQLTDKEKLVNETTLTQTTTSTQNASPDNSIGSSKKFNVKLTSLSSELKVDNQGGIIKHIVSSTPIADKFTACAQPIEVFDWDTYKTKKNASGKNLFLFYNSIFIYLANIV